MTAPSVPNVLVFGAEGIAGSAILRAMPHARGTTRRASSARTTIDPRIISSVDIAHPGDIQRVLGLVKPDVVINCAGIVKSECDKHPRERVRAVNGKAPHAIAKAAREIGARVIHVSTDCVYDGTRGGRIESDPTDATDLYGQTKAEGELVDTGHCITVRTSFIGHDPTYGRGLLAWVLEQKDEAVGYTNALWSGLSAPELARVIETLANIPIPSGLYHVSGPVISKADLLDVLFSAFGVSCRVRRVDEPRIDRTMDGSRFRNVTGYTPPPWSEMAEELARGA